MKTEPKRHPGGRPALPTDEVRGLELRIRVSERELAAIDKLAAAWKASRSDAVRTAIGQARGRMRSREDVRRGMGR